ncbi:MAG: hypothetical protein AAFQ63_17700, partial [Cyanobacteria bacterium J06621_11]
MRLSAGWNSVCVGFSAIALKHSLFNIYFLLQVKVHTGKNVLAHTEIYWLKSTLVLISKRPLFYSS